MLQGIRGLLPCTECTENRSNFNHLFLILLTASVACITFNSLQRFTTKLHAGNHNYSNKVACVINGRKFRRTHVWGPNLQMCIDWIIPKLAVVYLHICCVCSYFRPILPSSFFLFSRYAKYSQLQMQIAYRHKLYGSKFYCTRYSTWQRC